VADGAVEVFLRLLAAGFGPSRRFDAAQQFGGFLSEADMNKVYEYAPSPA
jgi:hypothetical protein